MEKSLSNLHFNEKEWLENKLKIATFENQELLEKYELDFDQDIAC